MPVYGKDFNYTGEYTILDNSDSDGVKWRVKFLSSGTFTPLTNMLVDVFLVGGGGGRGYKGSDSSGWGDPGCGGGGYTTTSKSIVLTANNEYAIIVGNGGTTTTSSGKAGGTSTAFNQKALGGKYGYFYKNGGYSDYYGGDGGSGGTTLCGQNGASGGIDGGDGQKPSYVGQYTTHYLGKGQGTTTREFGESTGDLYASGGGNNITMVELNSGNGANSTYAAASGIVIIRNHRD